MDTVQCQIAAYDIGGMLRNFDAGDGCRILERLQESFRKNIKIYGADNNICHYRVKMVQLLKEML